MKEISNKIIKTELVNWKDLKFLQSDNLKDLSRQAEEKLKQSIFNNDFCQTFNVWQKGKDIFLLDGHHRVKILKKLEEEGNIIPDKFPANFIDCKNRKEACKLLLIYSSIYAKIEQDGLMEFLELEELTFDDLKFDTELGNVDFDVMEKVFNDSNKTEEELDEIPEEKKEAVSKLGDLFLIDGRHRVLCGDSTKQEDVERLMEGKKADLGFNDPPYGMKKEKDGVLNDNLNYTDLLEFNKKWIGLQFLYLKDNGSFYCFGTDEPLMDIYSEIIKPMIKTQKATFRNLITWNKSYLKNGNTFNPFGASGSEELRSFPIADEKCLFVMCGVQGFNNNADNYFEGWEPVRDYLLKSRLEMEWDVPTMKKIVGHSDLSRDHWTSKSQFNFPTREVYEKMKAEADKIRAKTKNDAFKKEYDELKKEYYITRAYFENSDKSNNVWNIEITKGKEKEEAEGHVTPKPIQLVERAIKSSCAEGGITIDFFLGSGSTLIACEETRRNCFGMELEPLYIDVILRRYHKLYPDKKIECLNRGFPFNELFS